MSIVGARAASGQSQAGSTQQPLPENEENRQKKYIEKESPTNEDRKLEGSFKVETMESAENILQQKKSSPLHRKLVTKVYVNIPKDMKNKTEYKKQVAARESRRLQRSVQVIENQNQPEAGQEGGNLAGLNAQQFSDFLQQNVSGWLANELPSIVADNSGTQGLNAATNPNVNPITSPIFNNPTYYNGGTNPPITPPPAQTGAPGDAVDIIEAGAGYTTLQMGDGSVQRRVGDRNWRNNNPGNIEYGDFTKGKGALGTDGRFAIFPSYASGREAMRSRLFDPGRGSYRDLTLSRAISRWAPPRENPTAAYIAHVARDLGLPTDTLLSDFTPEQQQIMIDSMQDFEGFKAGTINGQRVTIDGRPLN